MPLKLVPVRQYTNVKKELLALGVNIRREAGEFRVCKKGDNEAKAYYTSDLTDALITGLMIAKGEKFSGKSTPKVQR